MGRTGMMLPREVPPADVVRVARAIEATGVDEMWVVEDCFYTGGLSTAVLTLAATERVVVGIGILPAVVRNAAFTAMELATLAGAFPGRLHAGLGHGVGSWMGQVGARPASWLTAIEEYTVAVRALLHGEVVDTSGTYVSLDQVGLEFPPAEPPPLSLGVRGPRSIAVAGRTADGLVLAEPTPPAYVAAARARLDAAAAGSDVPGPRQVTAYTWALAGPDAEEVLAGRIRVALAHGGIEAHVAELDEATRAHLEAVAADRETLSLDVLDELALRGERVVDGVRARHEAGADSVVLIPARVDEGVDVLLGDIAALGEALAGSPER